MFLCPTVFKFGNMPEPRSNPNAVPRCVIMNVAHSYPDCNVYVRELLTIPFKYSLEITPAGCQLSSPQWTWSTMAAFVPLSNPVYSSPACAVLSELMKTLYLWLLESYSSTSLCSPKSCIWSSKLEGLLQYLLSCDWRITPYLLTFKGIGHSETGCLGELYFSSCRSIFSRHVSCFLPGDIWVWLHLSSVSIPSTFPPFCLIFLSNE